MEYFLAYGDRQFENLLMMNTSNINQTKDDKNYYVNRCKRQNIFEFRETLNTASRSFLIDKIESCETQQGQLLNVIESNDKKVIELRNRVKFLKQSLKQMNLIEATYGKQKSILGKTFDDAFCQ